MADMRLLPRRLKIMVLAKSRNRRRIALFRPILPGANLRDRLFACGGALLGIAVVGVLCSLTLGFVTSAPALVAPMGASAVLLFAVPASPLAQPWPVIGGNTLSALVGALVAGVVHDPMLAGATAVALAIAVMSLTRCLHPPGGAAALTAVLGGPAVAAAGVGFAFLPVAVNSVLLVAAGWLFHRWSGHSYPHRPTVKAEPARPRGGVTPDDVDEAIRDMGEALDVSREDLGALLALAERHAMERLHGEVTCADVMSRDVATVSADAPGPVARRLLDEHGRHALLVVDARNVVVGTIGHAQLARDDARVADLMVPVLLERPQTPAFRLLGPLSGDRAGEAVIVDDGGRPLGVVAPADLLLVLARHALPARDGLTPSRSPGRR